MKHKIIQTENYLLVGNDNNSKRGWFYCFRTKNLFQDEGEDVLCCNADMNIIAHLPLNNSPILEGVDLLPQIEDDVERLAELNGSPDSSGFYDYKEGFVDGYYEAKEKYKYTKEDLIKVIDMAREFEDWYDLVWNYEYNEIIQSLQQPKMPVGFKCDYEPIIPYQYTVEYHLEVKPKTTINSQGLTQWVGKYIFD